jgi:hypothetical protein
MTIESGKGPKHYSLRGEWVELCFMARAAEHGIRAIRPWGDSSRYDFIVEMDGHFQKVQVKSTAHRTRKLYACSLRRANQKTYTKDEVDFFAVFIIPIEAWYIIPMEALSGKIWSITFSPHNSLSKYAEYREAWHLLRGE